MSCNKTIRPQRRFNTCKYQAKQKKLYLAHSETTPSLNRIGKWSTLSWCTCGRTLCSMCGNPRNTKWSNKSEQLTVPERKAQESFDYQMKMLYNTCNTFTHIYGDINEVA